MTKRTLFGVASVTVWCFIILLVFVASAGAQTVVPGETPYRVVPLPSAFPNGLVSATQVSNAQALQGAALSG